MTKFFSNIWAYVMRFREDMQYRNEFMQDWCNMRLHQDTQNEGLEVEGEIKR